MEDDIVLDEIRNTVAELAQHGLDAKQVEEAILHTQSGYSPEILSSIKSTIAEQFKTVKAQFFTSNQTAVALPVDTNTDSSYAQSLRSQDNVFEEEKAEKDGLDYQNELSAEDFNEARNQVIVSLAAVACLADERGFTKQADQLDLVLQQLAQQCPFRSVS